MAPPILRKILGPRGARRFDPARPLYVRRRISLGPGADGAMRWLEPGEPFPIDGIKPMRLAGLFASRHVAHEKPGAADCTDHRGRPIAGVDRADAPADVAPVVEAIPDVVAPTETPKPRRGRG